MARKAQKETKQDAGNLHPVRIILDEVIIDLVKMDKVNHVLTWKKFDEVPELAVLCNADLDDCIQVKITGMVAVGHGYQPNGYPESFASAGKSIRLTIEKI